MGKTMLETTKYPPVYVCPMEEITRIHERYCIRGKPWCVLRPGDPKEASWLDAECMLRIANLLEQYGMEEAGGVTERGDNRIVKVLSRIRSLLTGSLNDPGFINLYHYFFAIHEDTSTFLFGKREYRGLLGIWCQGYVFITCLDNARNLNRCYPDFTPSKEMMREAQALGLEIKGGSKIQVLYTVCREKPPYECLKAFLANLHQYLASTYTRYYPYC